MTALATQAHADLWDFLINEAAALDEHRYNDWLDLLTDDFLYEMPVPRSTEDMTQSLYDMNTFLAHESKSFLSMRFTRVESDHAWSERPRAFLRHFVTNFRVLQEHDGESWTVATNVLAYRSRLPASVTISSAGRVDTIVARAEGLRLQHRVVYLDTELPEDGQLALVY